MLRRLIGEDVTLEMRLAAGSGVVRTDPGQFELLVMNLVVNARDAMPGGGTISIETGDAEAAEFSGSAHWRVEEGRYVRVSVSDTGEGMDEATRARVFDPFFTTKPVGVGTGLGLATVYGIVKQSGGHIFVQSAPGQGSTFRIYLPCLDEAPEAAGPAPRPEPLEGGETILVVEDQEALGEVIREGLGDLGYRVLLAGDGETALELAQRHEGDIHLILTDVVMPQMSGPDLARRIESIRAGIKVLFMSGYTSDVLGYKGAMDRGIQIIEKPFTNQALARKLREVLASADPGAGARP
jgi:CheY-like chemotaxis protein